MGQRKLTDGEITCVMEARLSMRAIAAIARSNPYVERAIAELNDIALHGTTDGKPYIEPQPEIGEGYRLATESDQYREDRDIVLGSQWMKAIKGVFVENARYRVPVDRIPTDEDAKQRPLVFVKNNGGGGWHPRKLLAVVGCGFVVGSGDGVSTWPHCRFPYPGELNP